MHFMFRGQVIIAIMSSIVCFLLIKLQLIIVRSMCFSIIDSSYQSICIEDMKGKNMLNVMLISRLIIFELCF